MAIKDKVPPRVIGAVWKLWWNAWPTKLKTGAPSDCCFCQLHVESIYHFPFCIVVQRLWKEIMGIDLESHLIAGGWWLARTPKCSSKQLWVYIAPKRL